jgi:uncharacterized protein
MLSNLRKLTVKNKRNPLANSSLIGAINVACAMCLNSGVKLKMSKRTESKALPPIPKIIAPIAPQRKCTIKIGIGSLSYLSIFHKKDKYKIIGTTAANTDIIIGILSNVMFRIQINSFLDYKGFTVYISTQFFHVLQMVIKYTNFSNGIHEFQLKDSVKNLELQEPFFGNVIVDCKMDKSPHQIVLSCNIAISAKMVCDRCAKEFEKELTNHFQITYLFSADSEGNDDSDLKILSPDQDKINIRDDVFEFAELALPMKCLCDEDCKGLCPKCGINWNDSSCSCSNKIELDIWEPLKKLKDKLNSSAN